MLRSECATDQTQVYAQMDMMNEFQCEHKLQVQGCDLQGLLSILILSPWATNAKVTVSKIGCSQVSRQSSGAKGAVKNCFGLDGLLYYANIWKQSKEWYKGCDSAWTPLKCDHKPAPTIASDVIGITILVMITNPFHSFLDWIDVEHRSSNPAKWVPWSEDQSKHVWLDFVEALTSKMTTIAISVLWGVPCAKFKCICPMYVALYKWLWLNFNDDQINSLFRR